MIHEVVKQIGENKYACRIAGNGFPLVLLHGFTGSSKTWESFMGKWSSVFQIIAIDLPGHGKSWTPHFPTMTSFCDELAELLEVLHIKRCHLLGYSMGGRIALSFANRHPDFVESLILESASPGLRIEQERITRKQSDRALAEKIMKKGVPAFVEEWEDIPLFATQKKLPKTLQERVRKERLSHTASGLSQSLLKMGTGSQPSWWNRLDSLKMPVQLIVGQLDDKFLAINQLMEETINQSELVIVHEAGHAVHVEQAEKFATIIMEFLYLKNL